MGIEKQKCNLTEEEVRDLFIKKFVVKVVFTKQNGDLRHMTCTTSPGLFPPEARSSMTSDHKIFPNLIRVYDIEHEGWRSIIISNLISIT